MSRGKQIRREQERKNKAAAKQALAEHLITADDVTKKVGSSTWIMDEYRQIYNKCCPACRALIQRTGGKAQFTDYCPACQQAALPHLKNVQVMLGQTKKNDDRKKV